MTVLEFLRANAATITVLVIVAAVVILAAVKLVRDHKKIKNCGGCCSGCEMSPVCHKKNSNRRG